MACLQISLLVMSFHFYPKMEWLYMWMGLVGRNLIDPQQTIRKLNMQCCSF